MLAGIFAVCVAPLLGAVYFRFAGPPDDVKTQGEILTAALLPRTAWSALYTPADAPVASMESALSDKWVILQVGPSHCASACQQLLYLTRQARIAQYKDIIRVQRVWLVTDGRVNTEMKDLHPDLWMARSAEALPANGLREDSVYLVDRRGYLVMRYDAGIEPKRFIRELQRLVKF